MIGGARHGCQGEGDAQASLRPPREREGRFQLLVVAEDIGRHNTFDKIQGECLLRKLPTRNRLLLGTGRVSSEMLLKAAEMQAPVVVTLTSPTERAVSLARELGIALVGYARGSRLSVYAHPERLGRRADGET